MPTEFSKRPLPTGLESLTDLSLDLRLAGSQTAERIWEFLDPEAWERVNNPHMILQNCHQEQLDALAANAELRAQLKERVKRRDEYMSSPGWFGERHSKSDLSGVAYFSMEFGLSEALPIYSGGLGILAGDHMKSASDLNVPIYGIGLLYQQGYFRQVLAGDGWQLEALPFNDPGTLPIRPVLDEDGRWPRVRLELPGRTLFLRVWRAQVGKVNLYLLDSNHPLNTPWDRAITAKLYDAGKEVRLLQELVLGVGGWRLIEKLGLKIEVCHLNEGHAAFAVLARAASFARKNNVSFQVALRATRAGNVFTTHTPVEAAFDRFEPSLLTKYAQPFADTVGISLHELMAMGRQNSQDSHEPFNMAYLAMRGSCHINGVAQLHGKVSKSLFRSLFPNWPVGEVPVGAITNGVHVPTWDSKPTNELWGNAYTGSGTWIENLGNAADHLDNVSDERLWSCRAVARQTLVDYVRQRLERQLTARNAPEDRVRQARHVLDPNWLTVGFARRFTAYKRPNLVLQDAERFARILRNTQRPVQFIVAGKAHPNDDGGKAMVKAMAQYSWREDLCDRVVFLEDYDIALAQHFATGIDVWLNNPRRPAEACGTSGMKMIVNGGLHFSTLDGWWDEAYTPEVGFEIGGGREHHGELDAAEAQQMYDVLENHIATEFYERDHHGIPRAWLRRVRASMQRLTAQFSSDRMVREYVEQAYLPAASAFLERSADNGRLAGDIETWYQKIDENWSGVRFGDISARHADGHWHFEVQAYLGDLCPECIQVQLFCEPLDGGHPQPIVAHCEGQMPGAVNGFLYTASVPGDRPSEHYTPRIVPHHEKAYVPLESTHLQWAS